MRSKRFEPIREIAANAAKALSAAVGEAERKVTEIERKIEQLESYRADYARRPAEANTMDAVRYQNYRVFIDRLGEALRIQTQSLAAAREEYEMRRALWSEKRVEAESLSRVVDRFAQEERHAAERREQHEGDEAAARLAYAAREPIGT
jgi:flagellar FliJ protein